MVKSQISVYIFMLYLIFFILLFLLDNEILNAIIILICFVNVSNMFFDTKYW
jgi:hypothetical protein